MEKFNYYDDDINMIYQATPQKVVKHFIKFQNLQDHMDMNIIKQTMK